MKVSLLKGNPSVYSANSYLVRGDWNKLDDLNTLIDPGTDGSILVELERISTGVGKKRVEQIILTHEHFDHSGATKIFKDMYNPVVFAYNKLSYVDVKVYDYMDIKLGDRDAVILYTPGHSNDSICIYCEEEQVLFSGDSPIFIRTAGGSYSSYFVEALRRLSRLKIKTIYSGHDYPITEQAEEIIRFSLKNVLASKIVEGSV